MPWFGPDVHFMLDEGEPPLPAPTQKDLDESFCTLFKVPLDDYLSSPESIQEILKDSMRGHAKAKAEINRLNCDIENKESTMRKLRDDLDLHKLRLSQSDKDFTELYELSIASLNASEKSYQVKIRLLVLAASLISSALIVNWTAPAGLSWWVIPIAALVGSIPASILCGIYAKFFLPDGVNKPRPGDYFVIFIAFVISLIL